MTAMRVFFSALFVVTLTSAFTGGAACAQQDPVTQGLTTAEIITQDDVETLSVNFNEAFEAIENPFLSDIIKLSYQITLLQKMVDRQGQLERISESLGSMGASFKQPAPPRGICAQLPPNAPCLKSYPDLYPEIVKARRAYYDELKAKSNINNADTAGPKGETEAETKARLAREAKAEKERLEKLAKAERQKRYQWTEVSCVRDICKGVLVTSKNDGYRATVQRGSVLVDGTIVKDVTPKGIKISIDGDQIAVRPAAAATDAPKQADAGAALGDKFFSTVGGGAPLGTAPPAAGTQPAPGAASGPAGTPVAAVGNASAAAAAIVANAEASAPASATAAPNAAAPVGTGNTGQGGTAAGQTVAQPTLGPSGLF